jgi:hypothetical protein
MKFLEFFLPVAAIALVVASVPAASQQAAMTNPHGPTSSCGTVCPSTTTWSIQAGGAFGGNGAGVFAGTPTGRVDITKRGGADLDLRMTGSGCADLNCANGASGFTFNGHAFEQVQVGVAANGGSTGVPVMVENMGSAVAGVQLQVQRLQVPQTK